MNYYEHHLGDYLRDTAHLSMIEDGAYRRLLDQYYIREKPLPVDIRECCKLARASSKGERDAVSYILKSFFELRDDGYHQPRADVEVKRNEVKRVKAVASANARWNRPNGDANAMRTHSERNANGNAVEMRTVCSPIPNPQSPEEEEGAPRRRRPSRRCPEDVIPDQEFARSVVPDMDVDREVEKFRNWEFARPISDWTAAWKRWVCKARDDGRYAKFKPSGPSAVVPQWA